MDTAVLAGAIDLPDYDQRRREYVGCDWLPFEVGLDPLKDARAEIEQIEAYDAEQVDAEIAADKAREQSLGLTFGSVSGVGMVADAPSAIDQNPAG